MEKQRQSIWGDTGRCQLIVCLLCFRGASVKITYIYMCTYIPQSYTAARWDIWGIPITVLLQLEVKIKADILLLLHQGVYSFIFLEIKQNKWIEKVQLFMLMDNLTHIWPRIYLHFVEIQRKKIDCSLQALKISFGLTLWAVFTDLWLMMLLPGRLLSNAICMHCFPLWLWMDSNKLYMQQNEKYKLLLCIQFALNQTLMSYHFKLDKKSE